MLGMGYGVVVRCGGLNLIYWRNITTTLHIGKDRPEL